VGFAFITAFAMPKKQSAPGFDAVAQAAGLQKTSFGRYAWRVLRVVKHSGVAHPGAMRFHSTKGKTLEAFNCEISRNARKEERESTERVPR
jgi:hypothetical protein